MKFLAGVITTLVVLALAGLGALYSGIYDVSASSGHGPVMQWVLHTAMERSVEARAPAKGGSTAAPSQDRVAEGAHEFAEHCAGCHGAPGVPREEMAKAMAPQPPELKEAAEEWSAAQLRWIIEHGVKMTAMPAWGDVLKPEEIDGLVAFLQAMPQVSAADYHRMAGAARKEGDEHAPAGAEGEKS